MHGGERNANQVSSGSYFLPTVKQVEVVKKNGGTRVPGGVYGCRPEVCEAGDRYHAATLLAVRLLWSTSKVPLTTLITHS